MDIKNNKSRFTGFTLVEIMIALTIIGIVSVLTVPTIVSKVKINQYKSGVKKAHAMVTESFDSMKIDENYIYKIFSNDNVEAKAFRNTYAKYFGFVDRQGNVITDVLRSPNDFDEQYYPLNDTTTNVNSAVYNGGGFLARNGMMIMIGKVPKPDEASSSALIVSVDVDGPKKGENQLGRDVFCFEVTKSDNILPVGAISTDENTTSFKYENYCKTDVSGNDLNGIACSFSAVNTAVYMETLADRDGGTNCAGTWNKSTGTCQCKNAKSWDSANKRCICPDGYSESSGHCVNNNTGCVKVSGGADKCCKDCTNQKFNNEKEDWECTNNRTLVGNICSACANGETPLLGSLTCCDAGKTSPDLESCICSADKEWVGVKSACLDKCQSDKTRNEAGDCVCKSGFKAINGGLTCCPETITVDGGAQINLITGETVSQCIYDCGEGSYLKGKCECGNDAEWSGSDKKCVCSKNHSSWSQTNKTCECDNGREENKHTGECVCLNNSLEDNCGCNANKGFIAKKGGSCECDVTKGFSSTISNGECRCQSSLRKNEGGICVCDSELHRVSVNGECVCDKDNHFVLNGNICECDFGAGFTLNSEGKCTCEGQINTDGTCSTTCKNGATLKSGSSTVCECNLHYAELSSDKTECTCMGSLTINKNTKSGAYSCGCSTGQIQNGTNCIASGGDCTDGEGKYLDESTQKCLCADGLVEDFNSVNCACPLDWHKDSGRVDNVTFRGKIYRRIYCIPEKICKCEHCIWTSLAGTNGLCSNNDAPGLTYNPATDKFECSGTDVTTVNTSTDFKGVYSCRCNADKLTYKTKTEGSDEYGCFPENDVYEISSSEDLTQAVPLIGLYNFKLNSNVTITGDWTPWGTEDNPFKGTIDGQGKKITINGNINSENNYVGFFGYTENGCDIKNLNIEITGNVSGKDFVGALVGSNKCTITNVKVTGNGGTVSGENSVGGMVGVNEGSISYSGTDNFTVTASGNNFGGFAGVNKSTIEKSYVGNSVQVGTTEQIGEGAGGFVGNLSYGGSISNSYTQVQNVYANRYAGGFAGIFNKGSISYVYTIAAASANTASNNFVAFYGSDNDINISKSFFLRDPAEDVNFGIYTVYGRPLDVLKQSQTYICKEWNSVNNKCVWEFDNSSNNYPKLLTQTNTSGCESLNCYSNKFYNFDRICIEYKEACASDTIYYCPAGQYIKSDNTCIACSGRKILINDACSCPSDMATSGDTCVCESGKTYDYYFGCITTPTDDGVIYDAGGEFYYCSSETKYFDGEKCVEI